MKIGSYGGGVSIQPFNYSIGNNSSVSKAYTESVKAGSPASVKSVSPVQYPDAQAVTDNNQVRAKSTEDAIKSAKAFNAIASAYGDSATSYSRNGAGVAYSAIGSGFDAFA